MRRRGRARRRALALVLLVVVSLAAAAQWSWPADPFGHDIVWWYTNTPATWGPLDLNVWYDRADVTITIWDQAYRVTIPYAR